MKSVLYAAAMTVAAPMAVPPGEARVPFDLGGGVMLPLVPAFIGAFVCVLVRVMVLIASPTQLRGHQTRRMILIYNIAVTLLTVTATIVWIAEQQVWGPGTSFGIGLSCGVIGEGFVKIARSRLAKRGQAALAVFWGADASAADDGEAIDRLQRDLDKID